MFSNTTNYLKLEGLIVILVDSWNIEQVVFSYLKLRSKNRTGGHSHTKIKSSFKLKFNYKVLLVVFKIKFDTSKDRIASEITVFDRDRN